MKQFPEIPIDTDWNSCNAGFRNEMKHPSPPISSCRFFRLLRYTLGGGGFIGEGLE